MLSLCCPLSYKNIYKSDTNQCFDLNLLNLILKINARFSFLLANSAFTFHSNIILRMLQSESHQPFNNQYNTLTKYGPLRELSLH